MSNGPTKDWKRGNKTLAAQLSNFAGMGKRKKEKVSLEVEEERSSRFFTCYLLTSLCPRFKGHTYIGFTVNPGRRIRQHNGEVQMGAFRTKRKRPWEMVLCIYGFPSNVSALQFEWAWQHPVESRAVRQAAASFKNLGGVANKIKLAYTMLTLPEWKSLNLTINFFSTKYKIHSAGCPSLPEHMRVQVGALDELPCCTGNGRNDYAPDDWEKYGGSRKKLTEEEEGSGRSTARSSEENHIDWIEEADEEHSTPHREESYILIDSPVIASYLNIADKFKDRYELDDEFGDQPNKTNLDAYEDPMQTSLSHDNEVIDVFTPPCYKVSAKSKKRRASPEIIIDLTDSPIFV